MTIRITDIDGKKPSFVQWDVDRVLYIEGCDSQPCLHFANPMLTRAIVVEAEADGSRWICRVPNIILQTAAPIVISVFVQPDEGKTVLTDWVKVQPKLKPQDYTYEENIGYTNWVVKSAEAQAILDAIEDLRQEIAQAAESADDAATAAGEARDQAVAAADGIDESIATALQDAKDSGEFDGKDGEPGGPGPKGDPGQDGISPDVSVTEIPGGHRVTIVDADNTYEFDVMDGETGGPGAKGDPGDDGFSPEVSVTAITGGHRVTITDAQGAHVFDVMDGEGGGSVEEVYWATYNTTTEAEVTAAVTAGKTVLCKISDEIFYLVNKAAIGPSGSAWIFVSVDQTSIRATFVSGSYWNTISTKTIPSKTSDLTNDSGFVNASGAAAAAPVQSVNGQTGAVTVAAGDTIQSVDHRTADYRNELVITRNNATERFPFGVAFFNFEWSIATNSWTSPIPSAYVINDIVSQKVPIVACLILRSSARIEAVLPLHFNYNPGHLMFWYEEEISGWKIEWTESTAADSWDWEYSRYTPVWNDDIGYLADNKLDIDQGTANAGKFMVVGSDGNITAVTMTAWQGGSF